MKTPTVEPRCFGFSFPHLDTAVEVELSETGVIIRASRNTFSEERKACFIRELVAEGFIPEGYRRRQPNSRGGVRWIVDPTQLVPRNAVVAPTGRFTLRLILSATALWLFLLGGLYLVTTH